MARFIGLGLARKVRALEFTLRGKPCTVNFSLVVLPSLGSVLLSQEITDPALIERLRSDKRLREHVGDVSAPPEVFSPSSPAGSSEDLPFEQRFPVVAAARANGWEYEDLTGSGDGNQWGEAGGRSRRTGLTMAEMAGCKPPKNWKENADKGYPWQFSDFTPPAQAWVPPAGMAEKPHPEVIPELPPVVPDPELPPAGEAPPPVDLPPSLDLPAPGTLDRALLDGWSDDAIAASIGKLAETINAQGGQKPTVGKARTLIKGLKLDGVPSTLTDEAVSALIDKAFSPS